MPSDGSTLEYISKVDEFLELADFMKDPQLEEALDMVVKLQLKPDIPAKAATTLIVQLQAVATKCAIQASYLKNVVAPKAGTEEYKKKGMLYSISEALEQLVASLKYMCRI